MTPIATSQISALGYEVVNGPGMLASNIAQGGATLAVAVKAKNKDLKQLASSSGFTAVMGITEPCLYGVLLKLKRPFVASMLGGAVGGIYAGISGLVRYSFVSPGLTAIPAFIGENPMNVVHAIITIIISFAAGFAAAWILGFKEDPVPAETSAQNSASDEIITAPVAGRSAALSEVNDDVFSKEVLGKGAAILPSEGKVYAPADGTLTVFFETGHAVGIQTAGGAELLIHVGLDTVNLQGKYFTPKAKAGDQVKAGQLLLEFDLEAIKKEGYDTVIPIIVTNTPDYSSVLPASEGTVKAGDTFLKLTHV